MASTSQAIRRLLGDLRRSETRVDAVRRVRRRLGQVVGAGTTSPPASTPRGADSPDDAAFARQRAEAVLTEALEVGEPLERAVPAAVAALVDLAEWHRAWSLAEGVSRLPGGADAGAIGHAVIHHRRRHFDRAWRVVRTLDDGVLASSIPVEAVDAALATAGDEGRQRALAIVAQAQDATEATRVALAGRLLAIGERGAAAGLLRPGGGSASEPDPPHRWTRRWLEGWLALGTPAAASAGPTVAVFDARTPDPALPAPDLDDAIGALATVGSLARLADVRFTGDAGLAELASDLQARIGTSAGTRELGLVAVDRDLTTAATVPDGTWCLASGAFGRPSFEWHVGFPLAAGLRPVFVSCHIARPELLTAEVRDYLRRYGPVGCRDWDSVFLLLAAGVDAFFSGSLATTVDALHATATRAQGVDDVVAVIDVPPKAAGKLARDVRTLTGDLSDAAEMSVAERARRADAFLATARRDLGRAATSRLETYLALTSVGVDVDFRPRWRGDERIGGLTDLRPDAPDLVAMRDGIRSLLDGVLGDIVAGRPEGEVYERWRAVTQGRVAEARARFATPVADEPTTMDVPAIAAAIRATARAFGDHAVVEGRRCAEIVLCFDQNLLRPAAVLVESIREHATTPIRLWILGRGLPDAYAPWLASAFPGLPLTVLACDQVSYGPTGRPRRLTSRITVSTMDRLLLPDVLPEIGRVVYLDVDTLVLDDLTTIAAMDLGGRPVAARDSNVSEPGEWIRAGRGLPLPSALELRRRMAHDHGIDHPALNAGVLVMDLHRMRKDGFAARSLAMVERYGFHDQDAMLAYVGPDRAVIEPRWNAMPVLEDVPEPGLIHWASFGKPWDPALTYGHDAWRATADRLRTRAGDPPTS